MSTDHIATSPEPVEEPGSDKRFRIPNARGPEPQSRTHDDKNTIDGSDESSVSPDQVTGEEPASVENGTKYFPEVLPGQDSDINEPRATDSEAVRADDEFAEQTPQKEKDWRRRIAILGTVAVLAAGGVATGIAVSNSHGTSGQGIPRVTAPLNPNQQPEAPKGDSRFDQIITKNEAEQKLIREQLVALTPEQVRTLPRSQQARWQMYWRHEMQHEAGFTSGLTEDDLKPEHTKTLAELLVNIHYQNMLRVVGVMADAPSEGFDADKFEGDIMALCGPDFSKDAADQLKELGNDTRTMGLDGMPIDSRLGKEYAALQLKKLAKDPRSDAILTKQTDGSYLLVVPVVQLPPNTQFPGSLAPTEVPDGTPTSTMRFWLGKTPNSINEYNSAEAPPKSGEEPLVDFLVLDAPENIK